MDDPFSSTKKQSFNPDNKIHKSMLPKKVYESDTGTSGNEYTSSGGALLLKESDDTSGVDSGTDDIDMKSKLYSCLTCSCFCKPSKS